jgi:predicted ArsR family transcriptional regulator
LDNLIEGILDVWALEKLPGESDRNMMAVARKLAGVKNIDRLIPINKRLTTCMAHLSELQYRAQWEASPSGPRIKLGNCPYRKIIDKHPELCRMDKYLIEEMTGINISQVAKLEHDERGLMYCSFIGH